MSHPAFEQGEGILRLAPAWVPRSFCIPGKRLKLHPRDYYAFGAHRGGIDERWLSSTTPAYNGPLTTPDEGLSYVLYGDEARPNKVLLRDLVQELGAALVGEALWRAYGGWPMYAKFFDNQGPLPHHLHQKPDHAALVGAQSKPEAYYFPVQMNNHGGDFPHTFFGLEPGTTREQVRHCLEIWNEGDNHITDLSRAYRLEPGTGWWVPAGTLHAPGSLCTYEPQWASDVFAMFQSLVNDVPMDWATLVQNVPAEKQHDLDYILSMVDWEINVNPRFKETHFRAPRPAQSPEQAQAQGYAENWITYGNPYIAAKELVVSPGRTAQVRDAGPYGLVLLQGHGMLGAWPVETPTQIRFGQHTYDEFFVSCNTAQAGVTIHNPSRSDPLVMLKHFGPGAGAPEA